MRRLRTPLVLALASTAVAALAGDLGLANSYNAFVFGSARLSGGESEGPLAVGADVTASNGHNTNLRRLAGGSVGALTNATLLVGGSMDGGGGHLESGNGYVGGSFTSGNPYDLHNGATLSVWGSLSGTPNAGSAARGNQGAIVPASVFSDQRALSTAQAAHIAGLSANVRTLSASGVSDPNHLYLDVASLPSLGTGADASVKVVRMDASLQTSFPNLNLHLTNQGGSTVVFDVLGSSVDWRWKMTEGTVSRTLFSFASATSLLIGSDTFQGSILAPQAALTMQRAINGNVVAASLDLQNGVELHMGTDASPTSYRFAGQVPQAVPEPSALAALALPALRLLRGRRRV